jgi:hypothetical protein
MPRAALQSVARHIERPSYRRIETLDTAALFASQPHRLGRRHPCVCAWRTAVLASMCHRRVAKPVSASRGRSSLARLPPFDQLGQRIRAHTQTELTAEATQEPDWTDAAKRFDVLRFATRWAWRDRTTECCDPVLTHERLQHGCVATLRPVSNRSRLLDAAETGGRVRAWSRV